jgi:hypothetical protein
LPNLLANTVLIRASFLLEAPMQEMRDPSRCAPEQLVREHASHVQRIQKTLGGRQPRARLGADPDHGVSGRVILQDDPDKLLTLMQRGRQCPAGAAARRPLGPRH